MQKLYFFQYVLDLQKLNFPQKFRRVSLGFEKTLTFGVLEHNDQLERKAVYFVFI